MPRREQGIQDIFSHSWKQLPTGLNLKLIIFLVVVVIVL